MKECFVDARLQHAPQTSKLTTEISRIVKNERFTTQFFQSMKCIAYLDIIQRIRNVENIPSPDRL